MKKVLEFLRALAADNTREWFAAHKDEYMAVKATADNLAEQFIAEVARINPEAAMLRVSDCTYRIYRDTRFSPDKTPYKTHIGIFVNPPAGKKSLTLGYYLHIEPRQSFICGGTVCLPSPVIKAVRQSIYDNIEEFVSIVENPAFREVFPTVGENLLKTAPKGFPRDWEYIDYIRPKDFVVSAPLSDSFITAPDLAPRLAPYLELIKPFNDFINYTVEDFDASAFRR